MLYYYFVCLFVCLFVFTKLFLLFVNCIDACVKTFFFYLLEIIIVIRMYDDCTKGI